MGSNRIILEPWWRKPLVKYFGFYPMWVVVLADEAIARKTKQ